MCTPSLTGAFLSLPLYGPQTRGEALCGIEEGGMVKLLFCMGAERSTHYEIAV